MQPSEIEILIGSKAEPDRKECIAILLKHLQQNPTDVKSWYDLACCFDFLGREMEAEPNYTKVFQLGVGQLPLKDQMGFYVGYGSTLRNNKNFNESKRVLREGINKFPNYAPLRVFLGFTLYSTGEHKEANKVLFRMAGDLSADVLDGYERAVRRYSESLDNPA